MGLPCSGKSTIGRRLARQFGLPFFDSDAVVERKTGQRIAGMFASRGEAAFRNLEAAAIRRLLKSEAGVLATGGGAVTSASTRALLRQRTFCVYLHALPADLVERAKRSTGRPLLADSDPLTTLERLYAGRDELYRQTAHVTIEISSEPVAVLAERIASAHAAAAQISTSAPTSAF